MDIEIIIYYLEMTSRQQLRAKEKSNPNFEVREACLPLPEMNRFFYTTVGRDFYWTDRLAWTIEQWAAWVDRPELRTWVGYLSGTPAGYFELETQPGDAVELTYFGLLPQFTGQGLGGYFLTQAIEQAWAMNAARVWVHTCTLDHTSALANYQSRGFTLYDQKVHTHHVPNVAQMD
ncbi:MAG: GNAT family N-acetyltransferase [Anaerolineae bacterium]|nr:GNAT family N-acetyltransferase [Anaerolineae bacterium]